MQSALFDPAQKFKKQFDAWQKTLVSQLGEADRNTARGNGYQTRRFEVYREIFAREFPAIEAWFDELNTLIVAAPNAEASHIIRF
jgi:hypothetical protein